PIYGLGREGVYRAGAMNLDSIPADTLFTRLLDERFYELSDHLGNPRMIISDRKLSDLNAGVPEKFRADVRSYGNYYPYGMEQPGRYFMSDLYRYGFNGMEKDTAITGDHTTSYYRQYDARLGRWMGRDPVFSGNSPYMAMGGNPVLLVDPSGAVESTPLGVGDGGKGEKNPGPDPNLDRISERMEQLVKQWEQQQGLTGYMTGMLSAAFDNKTIYNQNAAQQFGKPYNSNQYYAFAKYVFNGGDKGSWYGDFSQAKAMKMLDKVIIVDQLQKQLMPAGDYSPYINMTTINPVTQAVSDIDVGIDIDIGYFYANLPAVGRVELKDLPDWLRDKLAPVLKPEYDGYRFTVPSFNPDGTESSTEWGPGSGNERFTNVSFFGEVKTVNAPPEGRKMINKLNEAIGQLTERKKALDAEPPSDGRVQANVPLLIIDKQEWLKLRSSGNDGPDILLYNLNNIGGQLILIDGLNDWTKTSIDDLAKYVQTNWGSNVPKPRSR
ncbi:MAG: RHS repeat-associated core domain-containing protein, partial [Bacteroidota bacterium]